MIFTLTPPQAIHGYWIACAKNTTTCTKAFGTGRDPNEAVEAAIEELELLGG